VPSPTAADTFHKAEGTGPPLVLIHGVGLDLDMWDALAAALAPRHQVVRYDMIGHGGTPAQVGESGSGRLELGDFVDQLDELLRSLDLSRIALIGFSMGALVAQTFAIAQPNRVRRLAIVNGVYDRDPAQRAAVLARWRAAVEQGPEALIEAALVRWFSPDFAARNPAVPAALRRRLEGNDRDGFLAAYRVFAEADAALAGRLGAIPCPALVMTGSDDPGSTPEMARAMAAVLPNARLEILPGARHMMPLEAAAAVNAALGAFLDEDG